jgi:hypothetical protein
MRVWLLIGVSVIAAIAAVVYLVIAGRIWTDYCPSSGQRICLAVDYTHSVWFYFGTGLAAAIVSLACLLVAVRSHRRSSTVGGL